MTASRQLKHLVFVHGGGRHYECYSRCWWDSFQEYLAPDDYDLVEILWNPVGEETANCSRDKYPGDWIEIPRSTDLNGEIDRYLNDRDVLTERFREQVAEFLANGDQVDIICHSLGTVFAYEALHRMWQESAHEKGSIRNLFTVGSILTWPKILFNLIDEAKPLRKPELVETWVNVMDVGKLFPYRPADFAHLLALCHNIRDCYTGVTDYSESFIPSADCPRCEFSPPGRVTELEKPFACAHFYYFDHENQRVNEGIFARHLNGRV